MGLPLRSKLLGQAAAKAKQRRFCVRCSASGEWGGRESGEGDGESRHPRTAATGGCGVGSQEAPAPLTPALGCQPRESAETLVEWLGAAGGGRQAEDGGLEEERGGPLSSDSHPTFPPCASTGRSSSALEPSHLGLPVQEPPL